MVRTQLTAVLLAGVLLGGAACGEDEGASEGRRTTTTASDDSTDGRDDDERGEEADPDALEALMADDVPDGFELQPDDVGDTGPSDLDKAVRDDGDRNPSEARALLKRTGFRRGYQRLWVNRDDDELVLFVYEFEDAGGASEYAAATGAGEAGEPTEDDPEGLRIEPFALDEPEGRGFVGQSEEVDYAVVAATIGPFAVQVVTNAGAGAVPAGVLKARVVDLIKAQAAKLRSA